MPWRHGIGGVTEPRPLGGTVLAETLGLAGTCPKATEDSSAASAWWRAAHSQDHGSAQQTKWTHRPGSVRVNRSRLLQRAISKCVTAALDRSQAVGGEPWRPVGTPPRHHARRQLGVGADGWFRDVRRRWKWSLQGSLNGSPDTASSARRWPHRSGAEKVQFSSTLSLAQHNSAGQGLTNRFWAETRPYKFLDRSPRTITGIGAKGATSHRLPQARPLAACRHCLSCRDCLLRWRLARVCWTLRVRGAWNCRRLPCRERAHSQSWRGANDLLHVVERPAEREHYRVAGVGPI